MPLIGMFSDKACPTCPLQLICMIHQPFTQTRVMHVRVCKRCQCVYFKHDLTTYVCGVIRQGVWHKGKEPRMCVYQAVKGFDTGGLPATFNGYLLLSMYKKLTFTKGCGRGKTRHKEDAKKYDCFNYLANDFDEIRGRDEVR